MTLNKITILVIFAFLLPACYKSKPMKTLAEVQKVPVRTLFIGLDGVDYDLMKELKDEGHFKDFLEPVPLVSTFPSATTIGFTGIFRPLGVGKVLGYETRFYSYKQNKIVGGTASDVYKYPVEYKRYFDSLRHTAQSKAIMYVFPGMASKQDLLRADKLTRSSPKRVIMSYMGGTDGSAHILGRNRTKRTLIYMDSILKRIQKKHLQDKGKPIRIVLFSDHGFQYAKVKSVSNRDLKKRFKEHGFRLAERIESDQDVVIVKFGLLSSGVVFTNKKHREEMANIISTLKGVDLVFWQMDKQNKIYIKNNQGELAYFEYRGKKSYRYVTVTGDPLRYTLLLGIHGYRPGQWLQDKVWKNISYNDYYPDAGYRLYDSFFDLVVNKASIMFSLLPQYQFGSFAAKVGTWTRINQLGTHGGLFRQTTLGFSQSNMDDNPHPPKFFRYDDFFRYYLPNISRAYRKKLRKQAEVILQDHTHFHLDFKLDDGRFDEQVLALENILKLE